MWKIKVSLQSEDGNGMVQVRRRTKSKDGYNGGRDGSKAHAMVKLSGRKVDCMPWRFVFSYMYARDMKLLCASELAAVSLVPLWMLFGGGQQEKMQLRYDCFLLVATVP